MDFEEKQLVQRVLAGEAKAFREFIDRYKRLVAHIVFRMVANFSDREDVCQDVFVKAYENLQGFQFQSKLSTWLARIAYNTCVNYLAKKRPPLLEDRQEADVTVESLAADIETPYDDAADSDVSRLLHAQVQALPVLYRTIVTLFHLEGMKYAEIGHILALPDGTVKSYLFRARKMLREKLVVLQEDVL
ncbi:sigma-70 family RNA polymerase sigma factor [candidate division KSB1 bacterium]|nr:sigma-70 family RNA polymerase sigma factor [candidate division KSB1 bacterium]RQW08054.1 MAG: sigma-70 family RNA polymerase sigma factor [candidate division KSB1 bacterium]